MLRSVYCVIPTSVYEADSLVPEHTDPLSGEVTSARYIYDGLTFEEALPNARKSVDGTKVIIKDIEWTDEDFFGLNILIAASGHSRKNLDGSFAYGILQWNAACELMATEEWRANEDQ